ncbi:PREDICTED: uncharacterized protein LOC106806778 [Priapulus caudatus]|uniref:Uncharacterized protein LOC106806778 n=1 Tax=Priapulus caudatus TaxID=37621 RepID=A0ABM1DWL2_PRICU|nr:PREDICTED: uncharacterized protein LOC106806778 [Priapulus caudatus]
MLVSVLLALATAYVVYSCFFARSPLPIAGKYEQPGRWYAVKRAVVYVYWLIRRWRRPDDCSTPRMDRPRLRPEFPASKDELVQPLQDHPDAFDSVYMNGVDSHGNTLVTRIIRRPNRRAEVWLMLKLEDGRYFHFPGFPDTTVYNTDGQTFTAGGLQYEVLEPLLKWRVTFNGLLREGERNTWDQDEEGALVHVKFAFVWTAYTGKFSYFDDIHPLVVSDAVASEPWTYAYLEQIREYSLAERQYELWGQLLGEISVAGETERKFLLRGVKEHAWGIRDLNALSRYIINRGYLEDGTSYSISAVSISGLMSQ